MSDLIDRQKVIDKAVYAPIAPIFPGECVTYRWVVFVRDINALSPVEPEQKIGHWVFKHGAIDWNIGAWRCSECGMYNYNLPCEFDCEPYEFASAHYCPCCGARMEKVYE